MNIVVLCGGLCAERDVSISSGTGVAAALRKRGHRVLLMDIFFGYGKPYKNAEELFSLENGGEVFMVSEEVPDLEAIKKSRKQDNDSRIGDDVLDICRSADIVFLALHGEDGENGKIQAMFDIQGIKYTGSGYYGSALAMNKWLSKRLFAADGINSPGGIVLSKGAASYENVGFPCVVKPCSGGSSVGTTIVSDEKDYMPALELAFKYEEDVVVERYIKNREFTVGVIAGKAFPVIEIIPNMGFYDYKNKYQAGATREVCPAEISADLSAAMQDTAVKVYSTLMIEAYCRVDMLMGEDGTIYVLEANTLPGMTPTSLIPLAASVAGYDFGELCELIIEVSMEKYK